MGARPATRRRTRTSSSFAWVSATQRCPNAAARGRDAPRSARGSSRRTRDRFPVSRPGANATPASAARPAGDHVEVVDDLHVVGDEADRHDDHGGHMLRGEGLDVRADVGFEPRLSRRTAAALVHERVRVAGRARARRRDVRSPAAARRSRMSSAIAIGMLCAVKAMCAPARTSAGSASRATARLRANGPT